MTIEWEQLKYGDWSAEIHVCGETYLELRVANENRFGYVTKNFPNDPNFWGVVVFGKPQQHRYMTDVEAKQAAEEIALSILSKVIECLTEKAMPCS